MDRTAQVVPLATRGKVPLPTVAAGHIRSLNETALPADTPDVSMKPSRVSLAYVDAQGEPLDMTAWVVTNAWMVGIPGVVVALGFLAERNHSSVRAGTQLGAVLTLATACASRVWTLAHDRRHATATREWWQAHQAATRQRALRGSLGALAALVTALVFSLAQGHDFLAAAFVGPMVGALFVLAFCAESVRIRRARRRGQRSDPLRG